MISPRLLALPLCLLLAACSGGSPSAAEVEDLDPQSIPSSLKFESTSKAPRLTTEEKNKLIETLKSRMETNLKDLLLTAVDESEADRQERELELQEASPEVQAFVAKAKESCNIRPIDGITLSSGSGSKAISTTTRDGSVNGMDCPVSIRSFSKSVTSLDKLESESPLRGLIRQRGSSEDTYLLLEPDTLGSTALVSSNIQLRYGTLVEAKEESRLFMKASINATSEYQDGVRLEMRGLIQVLGKLNSAGDSEMAETVMNMDLTMDGKTYELSVHRTEKPGNEAEQKVYLNGEELKEGFDGLIQMSRSPLKL